MCHKYIFLKPWKNHYVEIVKVHSNLKRDQVLFLTGAGIEVGQHRDRDRNSIGPGQDQDQGRGGIEIEAGLRWK